MDNGKPLSLETQGRIEKLLECGGSKESSLGLGICGEIMRMYSGDIKLLEQKKGCSYELTFSIVRGRLRDA
jgi:hypothetical protein